MYSIYTERGRGLLVFWLVCYMFARKVCSSWRRVRRPCGIALPETVLLTMHRVLLMTQLAHRGPLFALLERPFPIILHYLVILCQCEQYESTVQTSWLFG